MKKFLPTGLLMLTSALMLISCEESEILNNENGNGNENNVINHNFPIQMSEADYNSDNTYYILNDDESPDVYFDANQRSFYVNQPMQVMLDDEHYFQLRFYSPRAVKNITVWAKIEGYEEEFKFIELEKVQAFQQLRVHIPFATENLTAYTLSGKKMQIVANPYLTNENLTFTIESDDPYWEKLQSNKCRWRISFGRYSGNQWRDKMKATHTREAVAISLNMSYMFSTDEFVTAMKEFAPFYSDANLTQVVDKDALVIKARNHGALLFGHCIGSNGLGGGSTYGLNEWCYLEHYADDNNMTHTLFHEFAHCMGFGHSGNMTYDSQAHPGWQTLCGQVYTKMSIEKKLPIYSRRFLHTRLNKNRYGNNIYLASKYIIEDPELDAIDGGLSPLKGETDMGGNDKEALTLKLDYTDMPGATATTFRPKDVYVYGDTLYVVNDADKNYSLEVFSTAQGNKKHLGSIKEWKNGKNTETFLGRPNSVTRANDKIYVTHESSRTEIFDAKDHSFITHIGSQDGKWGADLTHTVHAFDVLVYKGIVMIRDKRYVDFVEERLIQPATKQFIYARTSKMGEVTSTYGMAIDERNGLLYSTFPGKRIDIFTPADIRNGATLVRTKQLPCNAQPYALDFYKDRLFVSFAGATKFCEVNAETGEIVKDYTTIGGTTLQAPEKFCIRRNTLFVVDRVKNGECVYAIPASELN